jgi:DNA-binding NarL/FixJ family response regulator
MIRIVFADDHNLVREALRPFIERVAPQAEVREADNLEAALDRFALHEPPDLILLDLNMPGMNGFDGLRRAKARFPNAKVAVISAYFDHATVNEALAAGANAYIPKTTTGHAMVDALRSILNGETYVPLILVDGDCAPSPTVRGSLEDAASSREPWSKLTAREADILRLLIDGKTNKEIGRVLGLSEITVKGHLRNAYKKIGAGNRADAVRICLRPEN